MFWTWLLLHELHKKSRREKKVFSLTATSERESQAVFICFPSAKVATVMSWQKSELNAFLCARKLFICTPHTQIMRTGVWWTLGNGKLRVPIVINRYMHNTHPNMKSINTHKALHNNIAILWELTELNECYTGTIEMRFSSTQCNINISDENHTTVFPFDNEQFSKGNSA